jgi:hypothetical protein
MQLYSVVWTFLDILLQLYEFLAVTRSELDWAGQGWALKAQAGLGRSRFRCRCNWANQILVMISSTGQLGSECSAGLGRSRFRLAQLGKAELAS